MAEKIRQPLLLLLLDFIGMAMLGVGLAEYFVQLNWIPEVLRVEYFEFMMIFFGLLLAAPYMVWVIKNATKIKASAENR